MKGRKPTPIALRVLTGNPGKRPLPENPSPELFEETPAPPPHLGPLAVAEWERLSGSLVAVGILTTADYASFAAYCQSYGRWAEAESQVAALGLVVKSANGFPIANPYLAVANSALKTLHVFAAELGLTPSSRSRVKKESPAAKDPFADFLKSKRKGGAS